MASGRLRALSTTLLSREPPLVSRSGAKGIWEGTTKYLQRDIGCFRQDSLHGIEAADCSTSCISAMMHVVPWAERLQQIDGLKLVLSG